MEKRRMATIPCCHPMFSLNSSLNHNSVPYKLSPIIHTIRNTEQKKPQKNPQKIATTKKFTCTDCFKSLSDAHFCDQSVRIKHLSIGQN